MYYDDDDYYYRNADPRDHRANGTRPGPGSRYPGSYPGSRYPTDAGRPPPAAEVMSPMPPAQAVPPPQAYPYPPPQAYPYPPPASLPSPYPPPAGYGWGAGPMPMLPPLGCGYPPPGYGYPPKANMTTLGRVIRAATPLLVALLPLPTPPVPVASNGENAADVKGLLVNEANQIVYQTAIAESVKRDELVFALGNGLGIFLEKGMS